MRLTEKVLAGLALKAGQKDRLVFDATCPGLGVRLTAKGTRTFVAQWTDPATRRKIREPLGVWGSLTLEQARDAARARLGAVAKGIDVKAERHARKAAADAERAENRLTLGALVDDWAKLHLSGRRPRYRAEAVRAIKYAFAGDLKRPAARLSRADAVNVLDALVKAETPAIASRTLAYARACFGWAEQRGKVPENPFSGLPIPSGTAARERVLSSEELGQIWKAAAGMAEPWGPLFRMLLLTLARREEVAGMRWSELTSDLTTWTIPSARMKRGQAHSVALPEAARGALHAVTRVPGQDLVFSTTGKTAVSGFSKAKLALDKAARVTGWWLHDFRRTGVSALAAMGFDPIVADKLLAHQPAKLSAVARIYQVHDFASERQAALEAWAAYVLRCASPALDTGNVVPLMRTA